MSTSETSADLQLADDTRSNGSPVRVLPFAEGIDAGWNRFVLEHPSGTFFHQTAWKRVMERTYGYEASYFYAERDGHITGVAPAFLISNWVAGRCLLSLPFAVYGGVCASDPESEQLLIGRLERLADEKHVQHLELRERNGQVRPGYCAITRYSTFTIPLIADTEALYRALPKDIRYMIRKGQKAGLRACRGFDQIDSFYRLMTINLRRLGTPAFPRSLFENLIHEYPGQVDLTVVYSGRLPVAGGLSFMFREWMQPYYIGSLEEAKALAANDFLWWELVKLAAETGHRTLDFGRSKNGSGNFDFKKKWNPHIEPLNYQARLDRRTEMPNISPTNPTFELATNLWKKIPLGLTRMIGPHVVRWFP